MYFGIFRTSTQSKSFKAKRNDQLLVSEADYTLDSRTLRDCGFVKDTLDEDPEVDIVKRFTKGIAEAKTDYN